MTNGGMIMNELGKTSVKLWRAS